ncbi:MAG: 50S ribosomal protein L25, partial [Candidatus Promineifilaceae bacterium]
MSDYKVTAELRTVLGKGTKNLRLAGITPGIVYGKGSEPVAIQTNEHDLAAVFR